MECYLNGDIEQNVTIISLWCCYLIESSNKHKWQQAFREFLVSPALIRNYKVVISISFIWLQYLNPKLYEEII